MYITGGILLGGFSRYLIHFIAGVIFWEAMPLKDKALYLYSFIVNSSSFLWRNISQPHRFLRPTTIPRQITKYGKIKETIGTVLSGSPMVFLVFIRYYDTKSDSC